MNCGSGRQPNWVPKDQREPVDVSDAELTPAVERLIEVLVEPHHRFLAGAAGQGGSRQPELPIPEQLVEVLNAVGEEPQAHVARAGGRARAQREFPLAERQPGKNKLAAFLVAILYREAD